MKILICEDDFMTSKAVEHHLKKKGFCTVTAYNGREAIDKMGLENFDIFLVDIHMPYMNGFELLNYIRNELKSNVPVVVLTRIGIEETVQEAFTRGADDYITKPFNPDDLALRLKKLLVSD